MNYKAVIVNLDIFNGELISQKNLDSLKLLKKEKIRMAAGYSGKNTKNLLEQIGLESFFDVVVDGSMIFNTGSHLEMYLKACDIMGTRPVECLVVDETVEGIEAAFRGGFASVAMGNALEHEMATIKIDEICDLTGIVLSK